MANYKAIAEQLHSKGIKTIPCTLTKQPLCKWSDYQQSQDKAAIDKLFANDAPMIAVICSDGLEVLDFDCKNDDYRDTEKGVWEQFCDILINTNYELAQKLYTERTMSGGYHVIFRSSFAEGNQKLAKLKGKQECVIETRGNGGYVVVAPSPRYETETGSLLELPTITKDERDFLFSLAKSFDEAEPIAQIRKQKSQLQFTDEQPVWERFDKENSTTTLLENAGWTFVFENAERYYYRRPNKNEGISASVRKDNGIFCCFSTSTPFEEKKGYTAYAVMTVLDFGGDFSASAKFLVDKYGLNSRQTQNLGHSANERQKAIQSNHQEQQSEEIKPKDRFAEFRAKKKFSRKNPPTPFIPNFFAIIDGQQYPLAQSGDLVAISGQAKARKTAMVSSIASSWIGGHQVLNYKMISRGRKILWLDSEQPEHRFEKVQNRILRVAGILEGDSDLLDAYPIREKSKKERLEFLYETVELEDYGLLVIDGIVDFAKNFNDLKESEQLVEDLMRLASRKKILILALIHLNDNKEHLKMRGHLGTTLKNKADVVIEVTKDKENEGWSIVKNPECREINFPEFKFTMDSDATPTLEQPVNWGQFTNTKNFGL